MICQSTLYLGTRNCEGNYRYLGLNLFGYSNTRMYYRFIAEFYTENVIFIVVTSKSYKAHSFCAIAIVLGFIVVIQCYLDALFFSNNPLFLSSSAVMSTRTNFICLCNCRLLYSRCKARTLLI
jgi:hypothetical protein